MGERERVMIRCIAKKGGAWIVIEVLQDRQNSLFLNAHLTSPAPHSFLEREREEESKI